MTKMGAAIGYIFIPSKWASTQTTESLSSREEMKLLLQSLLGFPWVIGAAEGLAIQSGMSVAFPTSHQSAWLVVSWVEKWMDG